jgi:hypothetical protein
VAEASSPKSGQEAEGEKEEPRTRYSRQGREPSDLLPPSRPTLPKFLPSPKRASPVYNIEAC